MRCYISFSRRSSITFRWEFECFDNTKVGLTVGLYSGTRRPDLYRTPHALQSIFGRIGPVLHCGIELVRQYRHRRPSAVASFTCRFSPEATAIRGDQMVAEMVRGRLLRALAGNTAGFGEISAAEEEGDGLKALLDIEARLSKEERERIAKREIMAIRISNIANLILFAVKVYASVTSGSVAIIASTVDSLLDLLLGFIMWFTALSMQTPNPYKYAMGKRRMQPLPMIYGRGHSPVGMAMVPMVLPDGRLAYLLQQPGLPMAMPQRGGGSSGGGRKSGDGNRGRRYQPYQIPI